jgi:FimV-like protein
MWRYLFIFMTCSVISCACAADPSGVPTTRQSLNIAGQPQSAATNAMPLQPALVVSSASNSVALPNADQAQQLLKLSQQLIALKQQTVLFEKNAAARLNDLSQQSAVLTASVEQLMRASRLSSKSSVLQKIPAIAKPELKTIAPRVNASDSSYVNWFSDNSLFHTTLGLSLLLGGFFLLLLSFGLYIYSRRYRKADIPIEAESSSVIDDEFDFLNSEEGIAAKLDLARAYEAMQDYDQMRLALNDVIAKGNAEQADAARVLLKGVKE